ncbi:hypothetical protein [Leptospira saintgironsiae]|uniref:Uncharacterized protein n=1 Tax=Leptospira saintgironsiae TaxID=2023183 RepID=A0A2M9YGZ5_9LEPT|nr:hypothetical protein [Leptospira saintgironsiae]PJZ50818.1 hypothetical protein CH362_03390 [Leptospira saintgironsiae]
MLLSECSSILRDYDLISAGIDSRQRLYSNGETDYFDSLLVSGGYYSSEAFFIETDRLPLLLRDQNNQELIFYNNPTDLEKDADYLLWEICGLDLDRSKQYSFTLNGNAAQLLVSYNFKYPYTILGNGKRKFFPRKPAGQYVDQGEAVGIIPCTRYLIVAHEQGQVEGKNFLEIKSLPNKIYVFTYFYKKGFVKNYKKFL